MCCRTWKVTGRTILSLLLICTHSFASVSPDSNPCYGQTSAEDGKNGTILTISNQADLNTFKDCSNIYANLQISANFSGELVLPNLQTIDTISIRGDSITSISLPRLTQVQAVGGLNISAPNLTILDLPALEYVLDTIDLNVPSLQTWNGTDTIQTVAIIRITAHNITRLYFPNLNNVYQLSVQFTSPNGYLALSGTTDSMDLAVFGYNDTVLSFDFEKMGVVVIRGCQSITSPMSQNWTASYLEIGGNPQLEIIIADSLRSVGPAGPIENDPAFDPSDTFVVANNDILRATSFSMLNAIQGSLQITANPDLHVFDHLGDRGSFPSLKNITENVLISGNISSLSFPSMRAIDIPGHIGGYINITTTSNNFSCLPLETLYLIHVVKSDLFYCFTPSGNYFLPQAPVATAPPSHKSFTGLSKPTMIGVGIAIAALGFAVSTCVALYIIKKGELQNSRYWAGNQRQRLAGTARLETNHG